MRKTNYLCAIVTAVSMFAFSVTHAFAAEPASVSGLESEPASEPASVSGLASEFTHDYARHAEALNRLGLFLGTDDGFELERTATRAESAVMAVRLLGKEGEALSRDSAHPFSDVPEWANAHVGYLYQNNIARGVSDDLFGSDSIATSEQYGAFVLRALGYDDALGDFSWDRSLDKMVSLGIISNEQISSLSSLPGVLRGDAAAISYFSMFANLKGAKTTLLEKLFLTDKAITYEQMKAASAIDERLSKFSNEYGIGRSHPEGEALTSEQVFAKASDAVFRIDLAVSDIDFGYGSGFFISADGVAVTNMHVLMYMSSASVTTADGKTYPIEGVLALHAESDIAILKVKGEGFHYLEVGDPSALRTAQRIYCVGSPYGLDNTISDGLVSNISRVIDGRSYIQISAPIAPGSSGGALLNEYGQVVGVTTAGIELGQVNLATPITELATASRFPAMRTLKYLSAHSHFGSLPVGNSYSEKGGNDESPRQTMKDDTIMHGSISSVDDVDHYSLKVDVAAEILVSLTSDAAHNRGLKFEVSDPHGNVILRSRHYAGDVFSLAIGHGASAGKYTVRIFVDDRGEDWADVDYELFWIYHNAFEDSGRWMTFFEFEPNDDIEYANYIPDMATYIASASSADDVDYYSFTLTDSYTYIASIKTLDDDALLDAEVFDASGESVGVFEQLDDVEIIAFHGMLPQGTYYIKVQAKDKSMAWKSEVYTISGSWFDLEG